MISNRSRLLGPFISITVLRRVHLSFGMLVWAYARFLIFSGIYLDSRVYGHLRAIIAVTESAIFVAYLYKKEADYQISMTFYTSKISSENENDN